MQNRLYVRERSELWSAAVYAAFKPLMCLTVLFESGVDRRTPKVTVKYSHIDRTTYPCSTNIYDQKSSEGTILITAHSVAPKEQTVG